MKLNALAAVSATALLAACGGGGADGVQLDQVQPVTLADLIARGNAFETYTGVLNIEDVSPTPDSALATTGTAGFTGVAVAGRDGVNFDDPTEFLALGSTRLTVDFASGSVAGTANNFFELDNPDVEGFDGMSGTAIEGAVAYTLAQQTRGKNYFEGTVTGSLTERSGATFALSLPGGGGLVGEDGGGFEVEAFEQGEPAFFGVLALAD